MVNEMPAIKQKAKKILPAAESGSDTLSLTVSGQYPLPLGYGSPVYAFARYFCFKNFMNMQTNEPKNAMKAANAPKKTSVGERKRVETLGM
jgi:hypothetical protein